MMNRLSAVGLTLPNLKVESVFELRAILTGGPAGQFVDMYGEWSRLDIQLQTHMDTLS